MLSLAQRENKKTSEGEMEAATGVEYDVQTTDFLLAWYFTSELFSNNNTDLINLKGYEKNPIKLRYFIEKQNNEKTFSLLRFGWLTGQYPSLVEPQRVEVPGYFPRHHRHSAGRMTIRRTNYRQVEDLTSLLRAGRQRRMSSVPTQVNQRFSPAERCVYLRLLRIPNGMIFLYLGITKNAMRSRMSQERSEGRAWRRAWASRVITQGAPTNITQETLEQIRQTHPRLQYWRNRRVIAEALAGTNTEERIIRRFRMFPGDSAQLINDILEAHEKLGVLQFVFYGHVFCKTVPEWFCHPVPSVIMCNSLQFPPGAEPIDMNLFLEIINTVNPNITELQRTDQISVNIVHETLGNTNRYTNLAILFIELQLTVV